MRPHVSIIIPAYNEEARISETLSVLKSLSETNDVRWEIIVVDDGSTDDTKGKAAVLADHVIVQPTNLGKGEALQTGMKVAAGDVIVFVDADLGTTAVHVQALVDPVQNGQYDMTIAVMPASTKKAGFGLVKGLARFGIYYMTGLRTTAPLSGQRAIRKQAVMKLSHLANGFGVEVGLTIDMHKHGFSVAEIEVPFSHRETGRDLQGFLHRGRQFVNVAKTLLKRWRYP